MHILVVLYFRELHVSPQNHVYIVQDFSSWNLVCTKWIFQYEEISFTTAFLFASYWICASGLEILEC
jgi:hypothetical protein